MTTLLKIPKVKEAQVFHGVSWQQFQAIDKAFEHIPGVKFRYLDGMLEIMPISEAHEDYKSTIGLLLEAYMDEQNIRFYRRGGPSLGAEELNAMSEPDESYSIGTRKKEADLLIEVVITSGGIDKLEGYRRLGIREVWFWEDGGLEIYHLRESDYEKLAQSELLPELPLDLFRRYITYHDQYDAVREFRQALRNQPK
jgi:Uma2 family endonuclease